MPRGVRSYGMLLAGLLVTVLGLALLATVGSARADASTAATVSAPLESAGPATGDAVVPVGVEIHPELAGTGLWPDGAEKAGLIMLAFAAAGVASYFVVRALVMRHRRRAVD